MYYIPYLISWFFLFNGLFFAEFDNAAMYLASGLFMIAAMIAHRKD